MTDRKRLDKIEIISNIQDTVAHSDKTYYTMLPIQGYIKNYHLGKVGYDRYIARFQEAAPHDPTTGNSKSANNKPLAELWFGTHPSGMSTIIVDKQRIKLDEFLLKAPEMIGTIEHYTSHNKKLPFLLKILSISQPLSLQAHPDKKLAETLHRKDPQNYPDSNHKPELAIALTDFEVLCDFRPSKEILNFMKNLTPFRRLVGEKNFEHYQSTIEGQQGKQQQRVALAACFKSLMTCSRDLIGKEAKNLLLNVDTATKIDKELLRLIAELDKIYPGDAGVFAPLFLNHLKLTPGQAVYLKPNKLHAYIRGECIECQSCSNNVVRAGLTTKFRDVDTLLTMLNYDTVDKSSDILFEGTKSISDSSVISYAPNVDFKVDKVTINAKDVGECTVPALASGSFFLIFGGKATARDFSDIHTEHKLGLGSAGFIPPKIALKLTNIHGTITLYRSYV